MIHVYELLYSPIHKHHYLRIVFTVNYFLVEQRSNKYAMLTNGIPPFSPRPVSQVELELTPNVQPKFLISSAKYLVEDLLSSGVKKPF